MSFTETVKNELARIPREDEAARRAEMLALFRMSGSLITGGAGQMGIEFSDQPQCRGAAHAGLPEKKTAD